MNLSVITAGVGVLMLAIGLWSLGAPSSFIRAIGAFPRHRLAGIILTVIALVGSVYALQTLALGGLEPWKKRAFYLIPVAAILICVYLDELLAVRALGGLLLLLPSPWLFFARWSDSPWSYLPRILAYVFVIVGMYWVATPYRFRTWFQIILCSDPRVKIWGVACSLLGATQLALAFLVF